MAAEHQTARRLAVEPMGERRRARQAEAQLIEPVLEARAALGAAMHRNARRLVDHQHQAVAVENPETCFLARHGRIALARADGRGAERRQTLRRDKAEDRAFSENTLSETGAATTKPQGRLAGAKPAARSGAGRPTEPVARRRPRRRNRRGRETPTAAAAPPKPTWFNRLTSGLSRSSSAIGRGITDIFTKRKLDDASLDDLEDVLILADLGFGAATRIREAISKGRYEKGIEPDEVKALLAAEVERTLAPIALPLVIDDSIKPFVILVIGVNGSGKTTTIGKLAAKLTAEGKKVTLAAGDTFRAAAIEQLKIWAARAGADIRRARAGRRRGRARLRRRDSAPRRTAPTFC